SSHPHLRHVPFEPSSDRSEPILDDSLRATVSQLPSALQTGQVDAVIVRGPHHNGRLTTLGWIARSLGRGLLHVELSGKAETDAPRIRSAGVLSTLLHAMPVLRLDPLPGETLDVPAVRGADCPVG